MAAEAAAECVETSGRQRKGPVIRTGPKSFRTVLGEPGRSVECALEMASRSPALICRNRFVVESRGWTGLSQQTAFYGASKLDSHRVFLV